MKLMPLIRLIIPTRERKNQCLSFDRAIESQMDRIYGMNWIGFLISGIPAILLILSNYPNSLRMIDTDVRDDGQNRYHV